jgi:hypothetical protein
MRAEKMHLNISSQRNFRNLNDQKETRDVEIQNQKIFDKNIIFALTGSGPKREGGLPADLFNSNHLPAHMSPARVARHQNSQVCLLVSERHAV